MLVIYFHISIHVHVYDWFDIIWQIKNDRLTFDKNRKMKPGHLNIQHVKIKKVKFDNNNCLYLIQKKKKTRRGNNKRFSTFVTIS